MKGEREFAEVDEDAPYTCHSHRTPDPDAQFALAPVWTGTLKPNKGKISYEGNCFEKIDIEVDYDESSPETIKLVANTQNKRTETCVEFIFLLNTEFYHFEDVVFSGKHEWTFNAPSKDAQLDFQQHGIQTYLFCESLKDEILSTITTLKAFVGGLGVHGKISLFQEKVPEYMELANKEFMKWSMNWDLKERTVQKVEIDESQIQSGDYLPVMRLDGLDPMIMYGTGSHSGHTVMAMRFDGELYIVESQDAPYWPLHRVQRTPFKEWMKIA